jgi:hypothetical protein
MTATRETILPDSPAHPGRERFHHLTRKVVTAWAPFYVAVDFDHEAKPVKVFISQPGKLMDTDFGDVIDAIGEAVTAALAAGSANVGPIDAYKTLTGGLKIVWIGRENDLQVQDLLRSLEGAITGLIAEARAA